MKNHITLIALGLLATSTIQPQSISSSMSEMSKSIKQAAHSTKKVITNWFGNNIHEIMNGKIIRSAVLSTDDLVNVIDRYKITTIINLCGYNEKNTWWQQETRIARLAGIAHHNITLSADKLPSRAQVQELLSIFEHSTGPILVHCRAGKDRTGLVCGLFMAEYYAKNNPSLIENARKQLNLKWGHIASIHPAMGCFLDRWITLRVNYSQADALKLYDPSLMGHPVSG